MRALLLSMWKLVSACIQSYLDSWPRVERHTFIHGQHQSQPWRKSYQVSICVQDSRILNATCISFAGDYGVRPQDSTFKYVNSHTDFINVLLNSKPFRKGCLAECWTPVQSGWSRSCKKMPEVCENYVEGQEIRVFPNQLACCRPGQGAFANGCSWGFF